MEIDIYSISIYKSLFLGPKGAVVSYSIIYKTTKETHSSALSNQFFLTT